ncbi:MAG: LysR family transcriptional regulator [Phycisphaerales bacterium]
MIERLNYNHLRCFWAVAREGSIAAACKTLSLAQPTISKQIADLEDAFEEPLFRRTGRRMLLTDAGKTVFAYADDIFSLGQELIDVMRGHATGRPLRLHVGVSDVLPKLLTRLVLEPALHTDQPVRLVCREGKTEQLLADLALAGLDVVLTDAPLPPGSRFKAFNHKLGESPVALYAKPDVAAELRDGFPKSLDHAPILLPADSTALRRSIDAWLERESLHPDIIAEFEDTALLKVFADAGHGCFFAPTAVEREIHSQFGAAPVAMIPGMAESIYAVTIARRVTHPGVAAIVDAARNRLTQPPVSDPPAMVPTTR